MTLYKGKESDMFQTLETHIQLKAIIVDAIDLIGPSPSPADPLIVGGGILIKDDDLSFVDPMDTTIDHTKQKGNDCLVDTHINFS